MVAAAAGAANIDNFEAEGAEPDVVVAPTDVIPNIGAVTAVDAGSLGLANRLDVGGDAVVVGAVEVDGADEATFTAAKKPPDGTFGSPALAAVADGAADDDADVDAAGNCNIGFEANTEGEELTALLLLLPLPGPEGAEACDAVELGTAAREENMDAPPELPLA